MNRFHPNQGLEPWTVTYLLHSGVEFAASRSLWKQKKGAWIFILGSIYLLMNYTDIDCLTRVKHCGTILGFCN